MLVAVHLMLEDAPDTDNCLVDTNHPSMTVPLKNKLLNAPFGDMVEVSSAQYDLIYTCAVSNPTGPVTIQNFVTAIQ